MNNEQMETIVELRKAGYAIVIFTPDELSGAKSDDVEDRLVESGWDIIDSLRNENEDDSE